MIRKQQEFWGKLVIFTGISLIFSAFMLALSPRFSFLGRLISAKDLTLMVTQYRMLPNFGFLTRFGFAFAIFAIAFVVILFTKIEEPVKEEKESSTLTTGQLIAGALGFRHFALGALAIFLYMGIEVGVPNFVQQDLVAQGIPAATVPKTGIFKPCEV